jgi:hypothetical protein
MKEETVKVLERFEIMREIQVESKNRNIETLRSQVVLNQQVVRNQAAVRLLVDCLKQQEKQIANMQVSFMNIGKVPKVITVLENFQTQSEVNL